MASKSGSKFRLRNRRDIDLVFRQGRRLGNGTMTLLAAPNDLPHSRLAVAVSAAHGGAVKRNRVKRLCREAFRLSRDELPRGWDFVIVPRAGRDHRLDGLRASILSLGRRLTGGSGDGGRK